MDKTGSRLGRGCLSLAICVSSVARVKMVASEATFSMGGALVTATVSLFRLVAALAAGAGAGDAEE
jgi:hypothetical protein